METVRLSELIDSDFSVSGVHIGTKRNCECSKLMFHSEEHTVNTLLFLDGCNAEYKDFAGVEYAAQDGTLLYIPPESDYRLCVSDNTDGKGCVIVMDFRLFVGGVDAKLSDSAFSIYSKFPKSFFASLFENRISESIPRAQKNLYVYQILCDICDRNTKSKKKTSGIEPALSYLAGNSLSDVSVPFLAGLCDMSVSGFRKHFREKTGVSPVSYIMSIRIERAKQYLSRPGVSVNEAAASVGISDVSYFSRFFKRQTGYYPSQYHKSLKD